LIKYFAAFLLLIGCLIGSNATYAQKATFSSIMGGVSTSATSGDMKKALIGFKVTASGASYTFVQFNNFTFGFGVSNLKNGTLFRSTTNDYSTGTLTPVGNVVATGANTFMVNNFSETVNDNSTNNYFLVFDIVNTSSKSANCYINTNSFATDKNGNSNYSFYGTYNWTTLSTGGTPTAVRAAYNSTDLSPTSTTLVSGLTGVKVFGFQITTTSNITFSAFNIGSNLNTADNYVANFFNNIKLYSNTTNSFTGATVVSATVGTNTSTINFTGMSEPVNTTTKYYWLVVDCTTSGSPTLPVSPQFSFQSGITSLSSSTTNYNTITAFGPTYNYAAANVTVTNLTGGVQTGSISVQQSGVVLFGFQVTSSAAVTLSTININSTSTPGLYFGGTAKLVSNTTNSYSSGTKTTAGTVVFNGTYATITLTAENTITAGESRYYFLVADNIGGATGASIAFQFSTGQSLPAIATSSPASNFNTFDIVGNTLIPAAPNFIVTGANSTATNGITPSALTSGQSDIVLFGYGIKSFGTTPNITQLSIKTSGHENQLFTNGRLYRSTTNVFPGGSPLYTSAAISISGGGFIVCTVNETIPAGTTYYYWLVADCTNATYQAYSNYTFSLASGQSSLAIGTSPYSTSYNTYTITGNAFNIGGIYDWVGSASTNMLDKSNWRVNGSTPAAAPSSSDLIRIGVVAYQYPNYQPSLLSSGNVPLAQIEFGTKNTPTLTFGANLTGLTLSKGLVFDANAAPTITTLNTTPATITIASTGHSSFGVSSTFTYAGPLSLDGTVSIATGTTLSLTGTNGKLTNAANITNEGTITVAGESGNSGTINLTGTGSVAFSATTGTFNNAGTIAGTGSGDITISNSLTNAPTGSITQNSSGDIFIGSGSTTLINSGSILQTGSGTLTISGTGTISNQAGSNLTFGSGTSIVSGAVTNKGSINAGSGSVTFNGNFTNNNGGTVDGGSSVAVFKGVFQNLAGFTPGTGSATFNANYTNSGTFNYSAGTIIFNGLTEALNITDASTNGTTFNIVKFTGASVSKTIKLSGTGKFMVASTGLLKLTNSTTKLDVGDSLLTLKSDSLGSANVDVINTGSSIIGKINVERYLTGNGDLNYRGYRLLSSPVSDSTQTAYYNLRYLKGTGSYLTGSGGVQNGFDAKGGPTLYLYREDTSTVFSTVTNIKNPDLYKITTADSATPVPLPIGNGYFYFFRGNKGTNSTTPPANTILTATGHLTQGPVTVHSWFYSSDNGSFQDSTSLPYTSTSSVKGFSLLGNPYASSIDWNKAFDGSNGINTTNISSLIYIYKPSSKTYATYDGSTHESKDGGSNIIPSGQGFFVLATGSGAKLTFNESAKITGQPTTLLLNSAANARVIRTLHLKLAKDNVQQEETLLSFSNAYNNNYVVGEDAPYLKGYGNVSFASRSADKHLLAINHLPFPKSSQNVAMNVMVTQTGNYQLSFSQQDNIPGSYDIWLKDAYLKDSIDIRHNNAYKFVVSADTNSTGAGRFSIVMRLNPNKVVHLLSFDATKSTSDVKISWTAENEASYTTYVLERSTDGARTFKILDSLTSAGLGTYKDLDPSPILGDNYYRLKQTDVAGNVSYSNVVKVMYANAANTILANSNISIYPNPAQSTLNLAITNTNNAAAIVPASYKITITNSLGLLVKTDISASARWQGHIDNLLPGTYFIQVINTKNNSLTGKSTFVKL